MPRPWSKKNPAMSLFLSGANAWAGAARGLLAKEARRRQSAALTAGAKQAAGLWTAMLAPGGKGGKPKRRR